jgi:polysaccharide biosynthesis transport protein
MSDQASESVVFRDPGTPDLGAGRIDFQVVVQILRRRKWAAVGVLMVSLLAGLLITVRSPRIYRATATLLIEQATPEVLSGVRQVYDLGTGTYWNSQEYYQTQYKIIRSRPVAERVVALLGISGPDLAEKLRQAGPASLEARVAGDVFAGLPEELRDKLVFVGADAARSREDIVKSLVDFDGPAFIQGKVQIRPVKDSRLAEIWVDDTDPKRAAVIANSVADAYLEVNLDQKIGFTRSAVDWLSDQTQDLKSKLESSELELHEFKKANNLVSVSMENHQTMVAETLNQLNASLSQVRAHRLALESRRATVQRLKTDDQPLDELESVLASELIQGLKVKLSDLQQEEAELASRYTGDHPKLVAARKRLAMVQGDLNMEIDKLLRSIDGSYKTDLDNERRLQGAIESVKTEAFEINKKEIEYGRLKRDRDNNQALFDMVLKRQKEADLTEMLKVNNVRKLEAALPPTTPISPRTSFNMMVALFLGVFGGIALSFVVERLDNSLKSQEHIERFLGLPFLGFIPSMVRRKGHDATPAGQSERDQYVLEHPRSPVAECCRTIRTNLMFMSPERPAHSILVTSPGPREGKSTMSIDLGITMAQAGGRVLLVDTDMRRPRLHKSFGVSNAVGISTVILGDATIDQAIVPSGVPGLDLLVCGPIPPNPVELLHTDTFADLAKHLEKAYDRVIYDSPPVAAVADALVLASLVSGVVLVIHAGHTTWQLATEAKRRLVDVGGRIFGVVMNNVDLDSPHYNSYTYYYYYRSGYAPIDAKDAKDKAANA